MRIGIDAHIILPHHKRYNPVIGDYTRGLVDGLVAADKKKEHTWVLFFDSRMQDTARFAAPNVEIKHFPFVQYRKYLPVVYSHMLVSSFLTAARLDVFHSPEGLIPLAYPGNIVTTFHHVPKGESESNIFVRTLMLGARTAFAQLLRRAQRIIVSTPEHQQMLAQWHSYPEEYVVVLESRNLKKDDWGPHVDSLMDVYRDVAAGKVPHRSEKAGKTSAHQKKGA
jgi:hypothetical protein